MTQDNSDVQEVRDGKVTDMRIEALLSAIFNEHWDEPSLDLLFTEIVQEFIDVEAPLMLVSVAGRNPQHCNGVMFLSLMHLDFRVVHATSPEWPGPFVYMRDAALGISIIDNGTETGITPGRTVNQAAIGAIVQYARELSSEKYNQGTLQLH